MVSNDELKTLIQKAQAKGATVTVGYDLDLELEEGRQVIDTVQVSGAKGIGPFPMGPIAAAEALRMFVA